MIALNAQDIGATVRSSRQNKGWSQQELASSLGVSRQWVVAIEKGDSPSASLTLVIDALRMVGYVFDMIPEARDDLLDQVTGAA